jgi:hypothetical protein
MATERVTLTLDEGTITFMKMIARNRGVSVSALVDEILRPQLRREVFTMARNADPDAAKVAARVAGERSRAAARGRRTSASSDIA